MNLRTLIIASASFSLFTFSCIKSEGPNREADIVSFTIDDENLLTSIVDKDNPLISLILKDITGYNSEPIIPEIIVSDGATVEPASGTPVTFTNYQHYFTVKAQDGGEKTYSVFIKSPGEFNQNFEEWDMVSGYYNPSGFMWVNANAGVRFVLGDRQEYPTSRSAEGEVRPGSVDGKYSAKLSTLEGKESASDIMNLPVLAGNMYCGEFNVSAALKDPLTTTKFGQPYPDYLGKPLQLKAWYKYNRGKNGYTTYEYKNGKKEVSVVYDIVDYPDIYAILYKVPKEKEGLGVFLTALDIKSSDRIIAKALMNKSDVVEGKWTELTVDFVYTEEMDYTKYKYKLAIVLTSSESGADYKGAIGSEMYVDDLEIITEDEKGSN